MGVSLAKAQDGSSERWLELIFAPLLVTLGAGLALIWVDRTPNVVGSDAHSPSTPTLHEDQPIDGGTGSDAVEKTGVDQSPDSVVLQSADETSDEGKLDE